MIRINLHGGQIELPDSLVSLNGDKVVSPKEWIEKRRPEILELFRENVYGRSPLNPHELLNFEIIQVIVKAMDGRATRKKVALSYTGPGGRGEMRLLLFVPNKKTTPPPCFLLLNNRGATHSDPTRLNKSSFWPAEEIVGRGYAAAVIELSDLAPDFDDGFKNGVHALFDAQDAPRSGDAWGTIAAWAWGASRVLDYLETDADIDASRVALVGHSRGGKTSLWAGAEDQRFAMVVSNNSGSTGAAISRGKQGENIAIINKGFPHWFCENYKKFNDNENELPVDQHMLLALIAPRLLYVTSATEDVWSDHEAEYASCIAANPIYQLFGREGVCDAMPKPQVPLQKGSLGYHLRTGKHDMNFYDWQCFMDFADAHL